MQILRPMKSDVILSVIMPAFNERETVGTVIRRILTEIPLNLELIVVNDGSTDGTAAILDEMAARDSRIHVIHKTNGESFRADKRVRSQPGTGCDHSGRRSRVRSGGNHSRRTADSSEPCRRCIWFPFHGAESRESSLLLSLRRKSRADRVFKFPDKPEHDRRRDRL